MNNTISAYAAGIFDGEGYVDIYQATLSKASKNRSLYVRVIISQKDGKVMNWLQDNFGGYVRKEKRNKNYIYRWSIASKSASKFLSTIYPFLVIKKEQAKLTIQFEETKGKYLNTLKGHQGFRKLSNEEVLDRIKIKDKLKELKKKYTPYIEKV